MKDFPLLGFSNKTINMLMFKYRKAQPNKIMRWTYEPSSFFHLAYPKTSRKSNTQPAEEPPTKNPNIPFLLYNVQGMFIPNSPAIKVSAAIANDAMVNVN